MTINAGAVIDEKCAEEAEVFWRNLRTEPYGLLVNNKNRFSYSFMGSQKIGEHSLERKTAALVDDPISNYQMSMVLDLKIMTGSIENIRVFQDSAEAMKWLESP